MVGAMVNSSSDGDVEAGPTLVPRPCPRYGYCPQGSNRPQYCPAGWFADGLASMSTGATNISSVCSKCPPGTFSNSSNSTECQLCPAGYVCTGGTRSAVPARIGSDGGRMCTGGEYCPAGSAEPSLCPAGMASAVVGAVSFETCKYCTPGTYAASPGSSGCQPCPSSATSGSGASSCQCVGLNRVYQPSDSSCVCKPRHWPGPNSPTDRETDDTTDCEPEVFDECPVGTGVRWHRGACLRQDDPSEILRACEAQCNVTGTLTTGDSASIAIDKRTGLCKCP